MTKERLQQVFRPARGKLLLLMGGLAASAVLVIAACGGTSTSANSQPAGNLTTPEPTAPVDTSPVSVPPGSQIVTTEGGPSAPVVVAELRSPSVQFTANQQVGIWVTERGEVTAAPDLVTLSVGVEARATTVQAARVQAAEAMDLMLQALEARGIQDTDVQTQFFNISPEYVWNDRDRRQELVGYIVSNQTSVKIRDIDAAGLVIDEVAEAGGDLVRINSVRFGIEDTQTLRSQARENAVADLMAKAQQFADLTNVTLGKLVFLSETGGSVPRVQNFDDRAFAEAAAAPVAPTSISGGELTVSITVQGVFSIE